jgi:predicted nucleic acid-binding protein
VVSLDTEITPAAGEACRDYGLAPADAIIVATSRAQAATLLTCDKHLKAVLGLTLITNAKT